ncbi:MAG TPA: alpha/beta fold hydrolase, partial [Solirubrobacteraceae bacterium]|nr:alpha/beta fold hydrolase [Solirubrobacteraceae bacterium]
MPSIDLPHGAVRYRVAGPESTTAPPVVFVHGFLVSSTLWSKTADALAASGVRSYAADWPLGSHTIAVGPDADQSPRGIARQVIAFMHALELDDVTLVGNDTGGAICQFVLDVDASRIGRVVLTNCDAFTNFPPAPFDQLFKAFRSPTAIRALIAPMRVTAIRHSPAGFGLLVNQPLDASQTRAWVEPCLSDAAIRRDVARFAQNVDPADLDAASKRLGSFDGPALLVWGAADRFFKLDFARRLRAAFTDARLIEIDNGRSFIPHDE